MSGPMSGLLGQQAPASAMRAIGGREALQAGDVMPNMPETCTAPDGRLSQCAQVAEHVRDHLAVISQRLDSEIFRMSGNEGNMPDAPAEDPPAAGDIGRIEHQLDCLVDWAARIGRQVVELEKL